MTETGPERAPRVAIVTVSYNSGRYLDAFLDSTAAASVHETPVVVADNGSDDLDALRAATTARGAVFLALQDNAGYGTAVNRAVAELAPDVDWVLVSNPDVELRPGSVDRLVAAGTADDRVGAVGPSILETDGSRYPSARAVPSLRTGIGHALFANLWPGNPWTRRYHRDGDLTRRRPAGWLSGACLLVRRSAFTQLGGFDERYFMYFEDVDLGYRLGRAGWTNLFEPAAEVVHVGAHSTQSSSVVMRRAHHVSAYRFLAGKYDAWWLWPLRVALRTALAVRAKMHGPGT